MGRGHRGVDRYSDRIMKLCIIQRSFYQNDPTDSRLMGRFDKTTAMCSWKVTEDREIIWYQC